MKHNHQMKKYVSAPGSATGLHWGKITDLGVEKGKIASATFRKERIRQKIVYEKGKPSHQRRQRQVTEPPVGGWNC